MKKQKSVEPLPPGPSAAPTLARLSCWIPEDRRAEFEAFYHRHLVPLLHQHDLVEATEAGRPPAPGVYSQLFVMKEPAEVKTQQQVLARDPGWQAGLRQAGQIFGTPAAEGLLPYQFGVYRFPARPTQSRQLGPGYRQGLWHSFGVRDGLSSSIVLALCQDRQGRLWLGTMDGGVCRYDGESLETFTFEGGPLPYYNSVLSLLEDQAGYLWLGTGRGVCRYDGQSFEVFTGADGLPGGYVRAILQDRAGHLWFGAGFEPEAGHGVCRYDGTTFTTFTSEDGLADNSVHALWQDRKGILWFGTKAGLSRYDGQAFQTFTTADGLAHNTVVAIWEDRQGHLWFGTGWLTIGGGGVSRYDGTTFTTFTTQDGLAGNSVTAIREDRQSQLWFGTHGSGVSRYDGTTFTTFTTTDGLADGKVFALLEDRAGDVWVGTYGGGVSRYNQGQWAGFTTAEGLESNIVLALLEDRQGRLWFGTSDLNQYDGKRFTSSLRAGGPVLALLEDRQGRLWFTSAPGVGRYDGQDIAHFTPADGLAPGGVWGILEDRQGHLWFATGGGGASRYDGSAFQTFTTAAGLAHNWVWAIREDRQGHLWFATAGGLSRYDGAGFKTFTTAEGLAENHVYALLEDRQGRLWVGTWASGLCRYDGERFTTFTTEDGLANNMVRALFEDRAGQVWVGTYGGGVSRYDGQVFQTLSRLDGLVHDTVRQIWQDRQGDFWLATEGGGSRYRPQTTLPAVSLQAVVADRRYDPRQELHLPASQELVGFEFQGQSWTTPPDRLAYVYRLAGYEEKWQTTYQGRVEYHGLPLGEYTLQVKAVDRDLNYSAPATVQVKVEPDPRVEGLSQALSGPAVDFVGESPALRRLKAQLEQVAGTELTVLILGETGTGKGLAARLVHRLSQRQGGPFIQVSCGALPEGLVESELFGHEQGAFTGAVRRQLGRVELAQGGTLFLDEIGDLPLAAQGKLLRLLEEGTFERVGGSQELQAQVRIITATNRELAEMVAVGTFRQDLFFRLQVVPVRLPPLRQRQEDIPLLAAYFLERMAAHLRKPVHRLSAGALARLGGYAWPGNVRELEHVVKRAVVVCPGETVQAEDLLLQPEPAEPKAGRLSPEEYERQYLREVLEQTGWVISGPKGAAGRLGMPESSLRLRLKRLGLQRP